MFRLSVRAHSIWIMENVTATATAATIRQQQQQIQQHQQLQQHHQEQQQQHEHQQQFCLRWHNHQVMKLLKMKKKKENVLIE